MLQVQRIMEFVTLICWFKFDFHTSEVHCQIHCCLRIIVFSRVAVAEWLARLTAMHVHDTTVNLQEHVTRTPQPSVIKAAHSGIETQSRRQQKSETGVSVAPKMDMCRKKFKKINKLSKYYCIY